MMKKIVEMQLKIKKAKKNAPEPPTVASEREEFEKSAKVMKKPKKSAIFPVTIRGIPAEKIANKNSNPENIILYFHGGGFLYCSINTHRSLADELNTISKIPVILIDYRKGPEHKFPAALDDCLSVYQGLLEDEGILPQNIILGGDSAGGGLVMSTLLKIKQENLPMPKAVFLLSPWVDLTCTSASFRINNEKDPILDKETLIRWSKLYLGNKSPENPFASPLYGDLTGIPPTHISVGTAEVLLDDSRNLYSKLQKENVKVELIEWENMIHVFPLFGGIKFFGKLLPEPKKALLKISQFILNQFSA